MFEEFEESIKTHRANRERAMLTKATRLLTADAYRPRGPWTKIVG